ncbi:NAD-dependent epimerase/dehydratase family protein [Sphaerisporangium dianthi]|uniref:NAD-dependent epimerase/dehydratase family protein n=1 Tax=Sphaerisporangium dianthi TaxID=1436120 RepID=A0ABV9CMJ9_9ACTN
MPDGPLVTVLGASGFIGSAVAAALAARPIRLRLVTRRPAAPPPGPAAVEVLAADLTGEGAVEKAVAGSDAVLHLVAHISGTGAWRVSDGDRLGELVNLGLLGRVTHALRGRAEPPVVVFTGSTSQAGADGWVDGSEADRPVTAYDRQKIAAERVLGAATADGSVRGIALRLPTVYGAGPASCGPGKGVVAAMARRAYAGEPLEMWHDGSVERDLLHVGDAAAALLAALDHARELAAASEQPWVIGTGVPTRLAELCAEVSGAVAALTGRPPVPVVTVPPPPEATTADFLGSVADSSAFRRVTGWRPRVPWRAGVRRTVAAMTTPVTPP